MADGVAEEAETKERLPPLPRAGRQLCFPNGGGGLHGGGEKSTGRQVERKMDAKREGDALEQKEKDGRRESDAPQTAGALPEAFLAWLRDNDVDPSVYTVAHALRRFIR